MLEPSVKPKIYLVSISRNVLSSWAGTGWAPESRSPAAHAQARHRRASARAQRSTCIALPRSAGFKALQSKRAGLAPADAIRAAQIFDVKQTNKYWNVSSLANIRTILIRCLEQAV